MIPAIKVNIATALIAREAQCDIRMIALRGEPDSLSERDPRISKLVSSLGYNTKH
jgi:hypothetical protein